MPFTFNRTRAPLSQDDLGSLFALAGIIFGAWLRLLPPALAGFPINDGGLFYVMAEALRDNHYQLPELIHYNGLQIPFSYPPLAFYLAGALEDTFGFSLIEIFRWLPAIILIGTVIAFHELAKVALNSRFQAGVATMVFALLPRSITWLIMGGGVTRSLGQLFLILTTLFVYRLFAENKAKFLLPSIIFASLVCLTHPEAALHTILICALLLAFKGRSLSGLRYAGLVAGGVFVITAAWWLTILLRFGLDPFLSAAQTGLHEISSVVYFLFIPFSGEPYTTFVAVLAIVGIALKLAQADYLWPLLYVLPFVIEPRNAPNVVTITMSLMAGFAFCELILPSLGQIESRIRNIEFQNPLQSRSGKLLTLYIGINLLIGMFYFDMQLAQKRVSASAREAFQWIARNTPQQSRFLIITGRGEPFMDWTQEWFPVLTDRTSLGTVQGYEWMDGSRFTNLIQTVQDLQGCSVDSDPLACIGENSDGLVADYDFIYIDRRPSGNALGAPQGDRLIAQLQKDAGHTAVFQSRDIFIFRKLASTK